MKEEGLRMIIGFEAGVYLEVFSISSLPESDQSPRNRNDFQDLASI